MINENDFETILRVFCNDRLNISEWFSVSPNNRNRTIYFLDKIDKYLNDGDRVIDICGGLGTFGAYLSVVRHKNFSYTVLDQNKYFIDNIPILFSFYNIYAMFVCHDIHNKLEKFNDFFNIALCFGASYDLNCEVAFKNISSMVKRNGIFMFSMIEKSTLKGKYADPESGYKTTYDFDDLMLLLAKNNFFVLEHAYVEQSDGYNDMGIIAVKKTCPFIKSEDDFNDLQLIANDITKNIDHNPYKLQFLNLWVRRKIKSEREPSERVRSDNALFLIGNNEGNCGVYARVFIALAHTLGFFGRLVGLDHEDGVQGHQVAEIFVDGKWIAFDTLYGSSYDKSIYSIHTDPSCLDDTNPEFYDGGLDLKPYYSNFRVYDNFPEMIDLKNDGLEKIYTIGKY